MLTPNFPRGLPLGLKKYPRSVLDMWHAVSILTRYDDRWSMNTYCACDDEAGTVTVTRGVTSLTYRQQSDGTWREDPFICLDEDRLPAYAGNVVRDGCRDGELSGVRRLVNDFLDHSRSRTERRAA